MKIHVETPGFSADQKLLQYIDKKVSKLDQYYDRILDAELILKLENSGQIKDKVVETKLRVPGDTLFIKDVEKTFEAAVDKSVDRIKRQLIKFKELQRTHR